MVASRPGRSLTVNERPGLEANYLVHLYHEFQEPVEEVLEINILNFDQQEVGEHVGEISNISLCY